VLANAELKVFYAIVASVAIDVMHRFILGKRPSDMSCHNQAVFKDISHQIPH